jgi:hypothetical protein
VRSVLPFTGAIESDVEWCNRCDRTRLSSERFCSTADQVHGHAL